MRLANGIELTFTKASQQVVFTKLINNKIYSLTNTCGTCNLMFLLIDGYSRYTDEQFMKESQCI